MVHLCHTHTHTHTHIHTHERTHTRARSGHTRRGRAHSPTFPRSRATSESLFVRDCFRSEFASARRADVASDSRSKRAYARATRHGNDA